jgi:hypothetical protein
MISSAHALRAQMIDPEKCADEHNTQQRDAVLGYLSPCYFHALKS